MVKKRLPPSSSSSALRPHLWLGSKIIVSFVIFLCIFALLRLHSQSKHLSLASARAASVRRPSDPFVGLPKIAFLFLARSNLPLDFLWQRFFQNAYEGSFSIYIHSKPGIVFDESTTRCTFFQGRQLSKSVQVAWGESSMIKAEKLLLEEALQDPANQRFVLISDSCVPLHNFSYIYNYVMSSSKSFVDSFLDEKEGRYNPKMSPTIPKDRWRKGSQWITLVRKHAEVIVDDDLIFPVFNQHCKRRPALDLDGKMNPMSELEEEVERRTLTYTLWNESVNEMERQGWHPITFKYTDADPEHIQEIKGINHVYYETEFRTEWCKSNATYVPCFLFARKFSRGAAMRLLSEGVVGPFNPAALLS
ncbi:glycosyltransferase BC10-like isoform X2 [Magnolia sinica]|uniref:glycosyltransferase BC10-like isoform X2 n=1 Tax=Magnolia sinica TaxID=86752 RepID=UPI00265A491B|nr:glycosyltransferase BC10-like isoform X2 [Magnolia sinica]